MVLWCLTALEFVFITAYNKTTKTIAFIVKYFQCNDDLWNLQLVNFPTMNDLALQLQIKSNINVPIGRSAIGSQLAFSSAPWFLKIKVLRNQGLLQTLEKFQVLRSWSFFRFIHTDYIEVFMEGKCGRNTETIKKYFDIRSVYLLLRHPLCINLKKNPGLQDLTFF